MTDNVVVAIVSASSAVVLSIAALAVNAFWMGKSFDGLKESATYILESVKGPVTKIDLLNGSLHELDKRTGIIEYRVFKR